MRRRRLSRGADCFGGEDINPMDGVANLADTMLVLAVGIMLALVMAWDVDITSDEIQQADVTEMPDSKYEDVYVNPEDAGDTLNELGLTEYGKVFKDAEGNLFILEDTGE